MSLIGSMTRARMTDPSPIDAPVPLPSQIVKAVEQSTPPVLSTQTSDASLNREMDHIAQHELHDMESVIAPPHRHERPVLDDEISVQSGVPSPVPKQLAASLISAPIKPVRAAAPIIPARSAQSAMVLLKPKIENKKAEKGPPPEKFILKKEKTVAARILPRRTVQQSSRDQRGDGEAIDGQEDNVSIEERSTIDLKSNIASIVSSDQLHSPLPVKPVSKAGATRKQSNRQLQVAEEAPAYAAPQRQALQLDMPDKRAEKRQRHAQLVAKALENRGALDPQKQTKNGKRRSGGGKTFNEGIQDFFQVESEDSLISSYFDRNAKPIFVEHAKPDTASKHQTRKHTGGADGEWDDGAEYDDEQSEPGMERHRREETVTPNGSHVLADAYGNRVSSATGPSSRGPQGKEQLLAQLLQELGEEDRMQLEALDPETKEKILNELKVSCHVVGRRCLTLPCRIVRMLPKASDLIPQKLKPLLKMRWKMQKLWQW